MAVIGLHCEMTKAYLRSMLSEVLLPVGDCFAQCRIIGCTLIEVLRSRQVISLRIFL